MICGGHTADGGSMSLELYAIMTLRLLLARLWGGIKHVILWL